jgi:hypothetical protein
MPCTAARAGEGQKQTHLAEINFTLGRVRC